MTSPEAAPRTAADGLRDLETHLRSGLRGLRGEYGRSATDEQIAQWLVGYLAMQYPHFIEAEAAAGTALDVERLARALHGVHPEWNERVNRVDAVAVAAEYARLAGVEKP